MFSKKSKSKIFRNINKLKYNNGTEECLKKKSVTNALE